LFWVYEDKFIPGLRELSEAVHKYGTKIAIQLNDFGKVLSIPSFFDVPPRKKDIVCASPVPWVLNNFIPREATKKDINYLVKSFAEAGLRTKEAGFDAVEIHGAHGYLVSSFLSPFTNRRADEYGGSVEKRARFVCEIIEHMRQKVGVDFPIILRISASEYIEGGITIEDTLRQVPLFIEAGADALHVSAGASESTERTFLSYLFPDGAIVNLAEAVKKVVKAPVIAVGKIDAILAERILGEGKADFIALGRSLMADPELPNKVMDGRLEDICPCIYCNNCVARTHAERRKFGGLFCTVNPALSREREFAIKPTASPKKVLVVGGGLAGMEAARVLAERGHQVTLYERSYKLGGQWNIAVQQDFKEGYVSVTERLSRGLHRAGVRVTLNKEVTPEVIKEMKPNVVVLATGAVRMTLDVPGAEGKNVVQANDVVIGKARVGEEVVVIGGRILGMEVAHSLGRRGKKVSLVTRHRVGGERKKDFNIYRTLIHRLIDNGVFLYPDSLVFEIRENGVFINYNQQLVFLKADGVVMAVGARPENELAAELERSVPEFYMIGDCVEPRNAMDAIREGAELGRKI
jgi:2,4-dienoyl-CoA reductase-like NADH-dependent reductase (Old Yellow Enzyme family)/thioredoxin reductase